MNFKNIVWVAKNDGAMPPLTDLIPAEDGDEDDSDDEFVVGGATQNFRCPLTTNLLEDPLTKYVRPSATSPFRNNLLMSLTCSVQYAVQAFILA